MSCRLPNPPQTHTFPKDRARSPAQTRRKTRARPSPPHAHALPCCLCANAGKVLARLTTLTDLEQQLGELLRLHPRFTLTGSTVPLHLLAAQQGNAAPGAPAGRAKAGKPKTKKKQAKATAEAVDGEDTVRF